MDEKELNTEKEIADKETVSEEENSNEEHFDKHDKKSHKDLKKEVEELASECEKLKKQADEYKDKWLRSVAEFDNYKKRNANVWQDAFNDGAAKVLLGVLVIGDNLERALAMGLDEKTEEGIKNLKRGFDETIKKFGAEEIDPTGEKFDPNIAEAVMQAEPEEGDEPDTVKAVFEKGYKLKDKVIRYAKVSVVK